MDTTISVIIPSLNAVTLARTLEAVLAQSHGADEILVVGRDNAGILAQYPQVQFIDTGKPICAAAARNVGMATATSDIFLFTDSDCIPRSNWVATHVAQHQAGKMVVGGSVELHGSNYWAQSDNVSMFHDFVPDHPPETRPFLPTLNLSIRREVWQQVGGMDETFPGAAAEDTEWTIRINQAGYALHFEPAVRVQHAPARTTWRDVVRHWRNLGRSAVRVRLRYPDYMKTPRGADKAWWWRGLSLGIAGKITFDLYTNPIFWRYWRSMPVIYATKVIYCWSAANAIEDGYAFE